jgi:hypothetical protein
MKDSCEEDTKNVLRCSILTKIFVNQNNMYVKTVKITPCGSHLTQSLLCVMYIPVLLIYKDLCEYQNLLINFVSSFICLFHVEISSFFGENFHFYSYLCAICILVLAFSTWSLKIH